MTLPEQDNFLPVHQSAYRNYHSTETPILKIVSDAVADRGEITLLGLLDLSAAFDTVDHDILNERLHTPFGVRGSALAWINSFIRNRTETVVFDDSFGNGFRRSSRKCAWTGTFPSLHYTADVIAITEHHRLGARSRADDTKLYAHFKSASNHEWSTRIALCIEEIEKWMTLNRLKLNSDKSQFIWLWH